jgi:hypothetical protein
VALELPVSVDDPEADFDDEALPENVAVATLVFVSGD